MTAMKTATKTVATIDDGDVVFTVTGILEESTPWEIEVSFKNPLLRNRRWEVKEWLYAEEVEEFTNKQYIDYIMRYVNVVIDN